jgi:hypothetical protein
MDSNAETGRYIEIYFALGSVYFGTPEVFFIGKRARRS